MTAAFDFAGLTPDLILDACQHYGFYAESGLLALNSYENRVYQFKADDGQRYVVKIYRPQRWTPAQIQEEHQFAFELAAADIPVVAPLCRDGQSVLPYQGYQFAIFPSRGGRALEPDDDEQLAQLGRFLGQLHLIGSKQAFQHRPTLSVKEFLSDSTEFLLHHAGLMPTIQQQLAPVLAELTTLCQQQYQPKRLIRCHGDCHLGNLFYDQQPFFVDLDDCRQAPAMQDLWMLLGGEPSEQRIRLEMLLDEYQQFADFDVRQLALIEPLRAMRMVHYMAWLARRWSDPAFPLHFPWFQTDSYWQQQLGSLREQVLRLQQPTLSLYPYDY
jgi:Ser/Thr protein kinase RdoA (MazF antagonist)